MQGRPEPEQCSKPEWYTTAHLSFQSYRSARSIQTWQYTISCLITKVRSLEGVCTRPHRAGCYNVISCENRRLLRKCSERYNTITIRAYRVRYIPRAYCSTVYYYDNITYYIWKYNGCRKEKKNILKHS